MSFRHALSVWAVLLALLMLSGHVSNAEESLTDSEDPKVALKVQTCYVGQGDCETLFGSEYKFVDEKCTDKDDGKVTKAADDTDLKATCDKDDTNTYIPATCKSTDKSIDECGDELKQLEIGTAVSCFNGNQVTCPAGYEFTDETCTDSNKKAVKVCTKDKKKDCYYHGFPETCSEDQGRTYTAPTCSKGGNEFAQCAPEVRPKLAMEVSEATSQQPAAASTPSKFPDLNCFYGKTTCPSTHTFKDETCTIKDPKEGQNSTVKKCTEDDKKDCYYHSYPKTCTNNDKWTYTAPTCIVKSGTTSIKQCEAELGPDGAAALAIGAASLLALPIVLAAL